MGSFLKFEKMITPFFIQLIFWLGVIGSIIGGIGTAIFGIISDSGGIGQILIGIVSMFLGPIIVRVYCELLIVVFKMHSALISIRNILNDGPTNLSQYSSTARIEDSENIL